MRILVLNGPNINLLGIREPQIYGSQTYAELEAFIRAAAAELELTVRIVQSNHEGVLIDEIQAAYGKADGILFNPAGYTMTSIALLDALKAVALPTVEVHLSDMNAREDFRKRSVIQPACIAVVMGEGFAGYRRGLRLLKEHLTGAMG